MPTIEFRVAGFKPNENAYNFLLQLIQPAMARMNLTRADVRRIIFTDNDHYGPAIREFSQEEGYTDDGIYQGIGKTLPQFETGIYAGSNLVLHYCVIGAFASDADASAGERDAMQYAIYHELGHCVDYRRRQSQHNTRLRQGVTSFVLRCAEANAAVALSEYAACFFSAQFMSSAGFSFCADSTERNLRQYLISVTEKRDKYRTGALDLRAVHGAATQVFWRGIVEYAKLFAYLHGNPSLANQDQTPYPWPGQNSSAGAVLHSMSGILPRAWNSYPNCADLFEDSLTKIWFALSEAEGYRFEVKPDGDYLWLD